PDAAVPGRRETMSVFDLVNAVSVILRRFHDRTDVSEIAADPFTVSEKIEALREMVARRARFPFSELFAAARSRVEVVVTFLALLELVRLKQLVGLQAADFGEIDIEAAPPAEAPGAAAEGTAPAAPGPDPGLAPESTLPPADLVPPAPVPPAGEAADPAPLATAALGPQVA
ncbi:MAG: segregation/condensation protein A, partial [Verrucomicrobiota bacterium]